MLTIFRYGPFPIQESGIKLASTFFFLEAEDPVC